MNLAFAEVDAMVWEGLTRRVGAVSRAQAWERVRGIYATVPGVRCRGLCADSCTQVQASQLEREMVHAAAGRPLLTLHANAAAREVRALGMLGPCAVLDAEGRCSAYGVRPLICRAFGALGSEELAGAEALRQAGLCDHGCEPLGLWTMTDFGIAYMRVEAWSRVATGVAWSPIPGDSGGLLVELEQERGEHRQGVPVARSDVQATPVEVARAARARRRRAGGRRA